MTKLQLKRIGRTQAQVQGDKGKPTLHMPAETIHSNKFAGDFLICSELGLPRNQMILVGKSPFSVTKIYEYSGYYYTCPQINELPVEGQNWVNVGKKHSRQIFKAKKI